MDKSQGVNFGPARMAWLDSSFGSTNVLGWDFMKNKSASNSMIQSLGYIVWIYLRHTAVCLLFLGLGWVYSMVQVGDLGVDQITNRCHRRNGPRDD